ncbi:hypothetical protein Zmor_009244 [Zophobas morio]|uniref:Uncharacterized protein n=1 Tax=Zophobas morio TaxID=2755281 RepID=A0AA38MI65_9CUCU|nr:hypothetical protein Zmor_009244 [Zophobas morio]
MNEINSRQRAEAVAFYTPFRSGGPSACLPEPPIDPQPETRLHFHVTFLPETSHGRPATFQHSKTKLNPKTPKSGSFMRFLIELLHPKAFLQTLSSFKV